MIDLTNSLKMQPIVYVTRDIERAFPKFVKKGYFIITNSSPFAKKCAQKNSNIILVPGKIKLSTSELLKHPKTARFLKLMSNPKIVVFKNTSQIEDICHDLKYELLNPSAQTATKVEEKISQIHWLENLKKYLPEHEIFLGKDLSWDGKKFILQFNRSHTGGGTKLIENEEQINEIKLKFPNRPMKKTKYIEGISITSNNVVWGKNILTGPIIYQITGLHPFTESKFATIGNDWQLPKKITKTQKKQIENISKLIGKKLAKENWKGLFGLDFILDDKTKKIYLIEINARQPAGTSFESELQMARRKNKKEITTFEAHLGALLSLPYKSYKIKQISNGAQVIRRVTSIKLKSNSQKKLEKIGLKTIVYQNNLPGEDLLRIQSKKGIMLAHNEFNKIGKRIANYV